MTTPDLTTERLIVRPAIPADVPALLRFFTANAEHLAPTSPRRPADFLTAEYWRREIARNQDAFALGSAVRLTIFLRDDPRQVVGQVNVNNIVRCAAHFGDLGFALGAQYQGQGLMTEAVQAVIGYAFADLRLHRLRACYLPTNVRSGRLLHRLGFAIEGYARDYLLIAGRWQDQILTSLVNPSWQPPA